MQKPSFFHHAAVYALGDLLVMAAGFVLLPVYSRCLTVADFGLLEVFERVAEVAAVCLLARSIPLATFTFYKQARDEAEGRRAVAAGFLLASGACWAELR